MNRKGGVGVTTTRTVVNHSVVSVREQVEARMQFCTVNAYVSIRKGFNLIGKLRLN